MKKIILNSIAAFLILFTFGFTFTENVSAASISATLDWIFPENGPPATGSSRLTNCYVGATWVGSYTRTTGIYIDLGWYENFEPPYKYVNFWAIRDGVTAHSEINGYDFWYYAPYGGQIGTISGVVACTIPPDGLWAFKDYVCLNPLYPTQVGTNCNSVDMATINVNSNIPQATWSIVGPDNFTGSGLSQVVTGKPMGMYTIIWGNVPGYTTPPQEVRNVTSAGYTFRGDYNHPPTAPTITGLTTGIVGTHYSFDFTATDPDNDTIRYGIDWDNNGTLDQIIPGSGFVSSGVTQSAPYTWNADGAYTFQARTEDSKGGVSGWTSFTVTILPVPTLSLSPAVPIVDAGLSVRLDWVVQEATPSPDSCIPSGAWASVGPQKSSNGPHFANVTVLTDSIYTLTCSGPGGTITKSANVYTPSGSISAPGCTILPGGSGCNTNVWWNTDNLLGSTGNTPAVRLGSAAPFSIGVGNVAAPGQLVSVTPTNNIFTLRDTGNFSTQVKSPVFCTQSGPSPEVWTGSICVPVPIITIEAEPNLVRSGDKAKIKITVDSNFNLECIYSGGVTDSFNHIASPVPQSDSRYTAPVSSAKIVRIKCTELARPIVTATKEVRVNVVPIVQEI